MTSDDVVATVHEIDGQLVLIDPIAVSVIQAVERYNCRQTLAHNSERILHFANRIKERGLTKDEMMIVILNVDTTFGGALADVLMPGHDWQAYRDRGEIPYGRGLCQRPPLQAGLDEVDPDAAAKLRSVKGVAVLVADFGVVEVFNLG